MSLLDRINRAENASLAWGSVVLAIILFLSVNLISWFMLGSERVDLTQDKLFTVTESSRQVLGDVKEPITIRIYETPELLETVPRLKIYADRVNELLRNYRQLSNNKVRVERVTTVPFSVEEDQAIRYGLQGIPLDRTGNRGYFGLVGTNSVDDLEKIELLTPDREMFLEYDLTRLVHRLASPDLPRVAIIDGLNLFGARDLGRPPWAVLDIINKSFRLTRVDADARAIPKNSDLLIIIHPYAIQPWTRYAVDQWVLAGNPAVVFVDPLAENSQPGFQNPRMPQFPSSELDNLFKAWGVEMPEKKVIGDRNMAIRISGFAGPQRVVAPFVPWLQVRQDLGAFNPEDVATAQLRLMRMTSAGVLRPIPGATTTFTPLIMTTPDTMLYDELDVRRRPSPTELLEKFVSSGRREVLAARITGRARTAYPEGVPPYEPTDPQNPQPDPGFGEQIKESVKPLNLVVVADTDLLADTHVVNDRGQPISNNADFVVNILENMAGGNALIGLRGRGLSVRPFTRVEQIEAQAENTYRTTEQRLSNELEDTQQKLAEMQRPDQVSVGDYATLSREQQDTIADFNKKMIDLREKLRDVRGALRQDIDALDLQLKLVNILAVPVLIVIIGLIGAYFMRARLARHLRRRRRAA